MVDGRLRLQCRRGMLELDFILQNFLECGYEKLDLSQQPIFERLLSAEDTELWDWFMGNAEPEDPELKNMVECILRR